MAEDTAKNAEIDVDLSRRLHHALTTGKEGLLQLMEDPSQEVLQATLKNPLLDENHLVAMLRRRDLSEDLFRKIVKAPLFEESHAAKVAMVHNPAAPGAVVQPILQQLHLFELIAVCYLPGIPADLRMSAERAAIQRIPMTSLGNKLTLARRATETILEALLREGHPQVVDICLSNPRFKETAIFQFLNGPSASAGTISAIARHPRWKERSNVRQAVLRNRNTPLVWFTLFLPTLSAADIRQIISSRRLNQAQMKAAEDELHRRRK